jgi:ech hydrogenase subunit A
MLEFWIFLSVVVPVIAGAIAYCDGGNRLKKPLVVLTGGLLTIAALALALRVPDTLPFGSGLACAMRSPILALDFALLAFIFYIGWRRSHPLIMLLAAVQLLGMFFLEVYMPPASEAATPAFVIDSLGVTLVLVVSLVGSLIAYYALGYMHEHEEHLHLSKTKQPRFFAVILVFLGAMNGLALADDLSWLYFFWEVTTLCSFLLISHDNTDEANANAARALWMNMAGGVAFVFALIVLEGTQGTLSLTALRGMAAQGAAKEVLFLLPVAALCLAGFTKSAQVPFQSWLCGAMVAPTPVSALLHSSTMVKAGVYLVLRLAPLSAGTAVSTAVALCGGFTFLITAALAAGQSNGKKILAYSTISNLGLIITCAGINTQAAIAAGIMLLVFHAVSKGLLFLCVGAIEQKIGSRNIEDMRGLFRVMPRTALITSFGIVTMMLPPFGMLLSKWMALESSVGAAAMPALVFMLALGSGITVLFWARWAGILLGSANPRLEIGVEKREETIRRSINALAYGAAVLSFFAPLVYIWLVEPAVRSMFSASPLPYDGAWGVIGTGYGLFAVYPLYLIIGLGFRYAWKKAKRSVDSGPEQPYMGGIQEIRDGKAGFIGPMKGFVESTSANYYLEAFFGEGRLTKPANYVALVLFVLLIGGALQ